MGELKLVRLDLSTHHWRESGVFFGGRPTCRGSASIFAMSSSERNLSRPTFFPILWSMQIFLTRLSLSPSLSAASFTVNHS